MKRRQFTAEYKTKIVLEILREEKNINEISTQEEISVQQLHGWRKEFLDNAGRVFAQTKTEKNAKKQQRELLEREQELMAKVGQLTIENDWLKKKSAQILGAEWETKSGFKR